MKDTIITIGSVISAITIILTAITKILKRILEPLYKSVRKVDENQCKNFLVTFLKDVEKGEKMDEVEIKRAYEVYDHYKNDLHKNSYIHDKWEKLMK